MHGEVVRLALLLTVLAAVPAIVWTAPIRDPYTGDWRPTAGTGTAACTRPGGNGRRGLTDHCERCRDPIVSSSIHDGHRHPGIRVRQRRLPLLPLAPLQVGRPQPGPAAPHTATLTPAQTGAMQTTPAVALRLPPDQPATGLQAAAGAAAAAEAASMRSSTTPGWTSVVCDQYCPRCTHKL